MTDLVFYTTFLPFLQVLRSTSPLLKSNLDLNSVELFDGEK